MMVLLAQLLVWVCMLDRVIGKLLLTSVRFHLSLNLLRGFLFDLIDRERSIVDLLVFYSPNRCWDNLTPLYGQAVQISSFLDDQSIPNDYLVEPRRDQMPFI
jgi:hypothetical protein